MNSLVIENTPTPTDILRELRCRTDDALEEFVKLQTEVTDEVERIEHLKAKIDIKNEQVINMTRGKQYTFLKANEAYIESLNTEIRRLETFLDIHKNDLNDLDNACRKAETDLSNARKTERDFFDQNF